MRISKIQIAGFGKLKNFELVPDADFNVIYGDNESGKTTVMAFIKMALYGSSVRGSGTDNPRVKYLPFDGSPMGGVLYFTHDRVNYRLDCRFGATASKDKINLTNDDTGAVIPLGADETVGERFFNLSGGTFERTAFIGNPVPDKGGGEIAARLGAAGSPEGGPSFETVKKHLTDAKDSQFTKRKAGAGDRLRNCLEEMQRQLSMEKEHEKILTDAKSNALQKEKEIDRLKARKDELAEIVRLSSDLRRRDQLKEYIDTAKRKSELISRSRGLDREFYDNCVKAQWERSEISRKITEAQSRLDSLMSACGLPKDADPYRSHQSAVSEMQQAETRLNELNSAVPQTKTVSRINLPLLIAGFLLTAAGTAMALILKMIPAGPAVAAAGIVLLTLLVLLKRRSKGAADTSDFELAKAEAARIFESARLKTAQTDRLAAAANECNELDRKYNEITDRLICEVNKFRNVSGDYDIDRALKELFALLDDLQDKTSRLDALSAALGVSPEEAAAELAKLPDTQLTAEHTAIAQGELTITEELLSEAVKSLAALNERLISGEKGRPGVSQLERKIEQLKADLSRREFFAASAELAAEVLEDAYSEHRQSFGPLLNKETSALFTKLTGGTYTKVKVAQDLSIAAGSDDSFDLIPTDYLSAGTADQAYLALRLAVTRLLGKGLLPVFLDDTLLQFDNSREDCALAALAERDENQQIIMFTCKAFTADRAENYGAKVIRL